MIRFSLKEGGENPGTCILEDRGSGLHHGLADPSTKRAAMGRENEGIGIWAMPSNNLLA
jgi:hypothetical protein